MKAKAIGLLAMVVAGLVSLAPQYPATTICAIALLAEMGDGVTQRGAGDLNQSPERPVQLQNQEDRS